MVRISSIHRILVVLCFIILILPLAKGQDSITIIDKTVNFGMRETTIRKINSIIVHSTFNNSGGEKYDIDLIIKQFSRYGVSSHYVIGREGFIYQLVKPKNISFHAGKSQLPDGNTAVNTCSIGIELITSYEDSPTEIQINALITLVRTIQKTNDIKYILRHSDIAPVRKTDPWNMNWDEFLKQLEAKNI